MGQEVKRDVSKVKVVIQEARTALKVGKHFHLLHNNISYSVVKISNQSSECPKRIGDSGPGGSPKGGGEV